MARIVGEDGLANRRGVLGRSDLVDSPGSAQVCMVCGVPGVSCRGEADEMVAVAAESDPERLVPAPAVVVADDGTIVARPGDMIPASLASQSIISGEDD